MLYTAASCSPAPFPLIVREHKAGIHKGDPPSYTVVLCSPVPNFKAKCHTKGTITPSQKNENLKLKLNLRITVIF